MDIDTLQPKRNYFFWKNITLIIIFFLVTPITLGVSIFSLYSFSNSNSQNQTPESSISRPFSNRGVSIYASLPATSFEMSSSIGASDARPEILKQYLAHYSSPLVPLAETIVKTADMYQEDFRLIVAIAQQESNLCKVIPEDTYNCWGWGIHSKGTLGFTSYAEGIETVSKGIKEEYIDKGLSTPEQIMSKYTPLSNGSWAAGVSQFMAEME